MSRITNITSRSALVHLGVLYGAATLGLFGCKSNPEGPQVCHSDADGSTVLEVLSDAELHEHLGHGDSFGTGLGDDCQGGLSFRIDPSVEPGDTSVPGLRGGPPRPVGVIVSPDGLHEELVANEISVRIRDREELDGFLTLHGGTVLRDDTVLAVDDNGELFAVPRGADGWHLIKVDPAMSSLTDLPRLASERGIEGQVVASSDTVLRVFALFLRESEGDRDVSLNHVAHLHALNEHPLDDQGNFYDISEEWWMTEDDDPATPGDQGVSVGVAAAFEYLRHTGFPPKNGLWEPARLAVIDTGFDLDEETGLGNPDYASPFAPPLQIDVRDDDDRAGGPFLDSERFLRWHGQGAFGVCCSYPRNGFGGAGTGGEYVRPILIRSTGATADLAASVRSAAAMDADVINLSWGGTCGMTCPSASELQDAITRATSRHNAIVFASAGNDGTSNDDGQVQTPCELDRVICVGAINRNGANVFNWGSQVDIWAPTRIASTVDPDSAGLDRDDFGSNEVDIFGGTSASSPFAAGIGGLLKALRPELTWREVQDILQNTANTSPTDSEKVANGYVDAFRAVQAIQINPTPTVEISAPTEGHIISWYSQGTLRASLTDPSAPYGFEGTVTFESNRQGELCSVSGRGTSLSCDADLEPGTHIITATATDPFKASAESEPVTVDVVNWDPEVTLTAPTQGATLYSDQAIALRANVADRDFETFDVACPVPPGEACVEWTSNIDGRLDLNDAESVPWNNFARLSQGAHTLTVTARDGRGASASASVDVLVQAGQGKPSALILTRNNAAPGPMGYELRGRGIDPEDGNLRGASLIWYSSRDGFLGTGSRLFADLSTPARSGTLYHHVITLIVRDSDGNEGTDEIGIDVWRID